MRIKINLFSPETVAIPIDYNYTVYLNIRKVLFDFLKEKKRKLYNKFKRDLPDFTFSQLMIPKRKIEYGLIHIEGGFCSFYITAIEDSFIEYLIQAFHFSSVFQIFNKPFTIKKLEVIHDPEFSEEMKFKMLSPLLLVIDRGGNPYFLRPEDDTLGEVFSKNLVHKYNLHRGTSCSSEEIRFMLDQNYIESRKNTTKLITVRNIHYKAIFCPFSLSGPAEIISFAYGNGIGDNNQYGLGMIDVAL